MGEMTLDYRVPPDNLQPYVTLFYHFCADMPLLDDIERAQNAQFRVRLSPGEGVYRFPDGSEHDSRGCHVLGPTSGAVKVRVEGPVVLIGAGLTPAGWAAILGITPQAMANRALNVEALFGALVPDAIAQIGTAAGVDARIALLAALIERLVAGHPPAGLEFARQVEDWLSEGASPDLDVLVATTGLSRRQVERRCNALYGAPPKALARKYRALRAATALATGDRSLSDVILDGFYDQSHLIREVKEFTGLTPKQLRQPPSPLSQLTIEQRHALAGKVHPLISET